MKRLVLIALFAGIGHWVAAQVIFRNDFVINVKERRLKNKGITFVAVNLNRFPSWNYLLNGRGGNVLVVDVQALRGKKKSYTYTELAARTYVSPLALTPVIHPVPLYLLMPPPEIKMPLFYQRHLFIN